MRLLSEFLFLLVFVLLAAAWFLLWAVLHLVSGVIHLLLVIAAVAFVLHLLRGRRLLA